MIVTRPDLEAALDHLRRDVADPDAGIHGPGSPAWRVHRESVLFVGGGKAALLQLAHPYVAHGVDQHSRTREDVLGRFNRTFMNVFAMTFGTLDDAFTAARRVHNIHTRITGEIAEDVGRFRRGHRYQANDVDALLWVYATLMHTSVEITELLVRRMGADEKDRYYQDTKRFAYLFGIPDEALPADWDAFDRYVAEMIDSDTLAVGEPAREMAHFLFTPPSPSHARITGWGRTMTAGLLPPRLRHEYGLDLSPAQRATFRSSLLALRAVYPRLPRAVRYLPAYVDARRRLAGRGPSRVSAVVERLMMYGVGGRAARPA